MNAVCVNNARSMKYMFLKIDGCIFVVLAFYILAPPLLNGLTFFNTQGPVVRKLDKVIHRIATFSNVLKLLFYLNAQI